MAKLIATVVDGVDSLFRKMGGQRLCAYCHQWAKQPYKSGEDFFCDKIHASIHFNKQQELMKKALKNRQEKEG